MRSAAIKPDDPTLKVFKLSRPLKNLDGQDIAELHLAEPSARQWIEAIKRNDGEADHRLLCAVSGLDGSVIDQMSIGDFTRCTLFLASFAANSQTGGET